MRTLLSLVLVCLIATTLNAAVALKSNDVRNARTKAITSNLIKEWVEYSKGDPVWLRDYEIRQILKDPGKTVSSKKSFDYFEGIPPWFDESHRIDTVTTTKWDGRYYINTYQIFMVKPGNSNYVYLFFIMVIIFIFTTLIVGINRNYSLYNPREKTYEKFISERFFTRIEIIVILFCLPSLFGIISWLIPFRESYRAGAIILFVLLIPIFAFLSYSIRNLFLKSQYYNYQKNKTPG